MRVRIAVSVFILVASVIGVLVSAAMFDWRVFPREADNPEAFNTHNLVRLHVVANSDSEDDQSLKLHVRDAVLRETQRLLASAKTKAEAWRVLLENTGKIQAVAAAEVEEAGKRYRARVDMGTFRFPERSYGEVTLPEGSYEALRIVLGAGEGRNWWCVLFPPLCFIGLDQARQIDGLGSELSPGESLARLRLRLAEAPAIRPPPSPAALERASFPLPSEVFALVPPFSALAHGAAWVGVSYRLSLETSPGPPAVL